MGGGCEISCLRILVGMETRADSAARSVLAVFGRRVLTGRLGEIVRPGRDRSQWHYWWQAHLVDCLTDAGLRGSSAVRPGAARSVLRGIWLRNHLRYRNHFFDDMAWLALAAHRAGRPVPRLDRALRSALAPEGGAWWNAGRDFRNAATAGPLALYLARTGERAEAQVLLGWMVSELADPRTGLLRDGIRHEEGREVLVEHVFTYNQGPALGVMLELGRLDEAASLVHAVGRHLTLPGSAVLRTHGGGDGGLFTGILTRYLALAARDDRLEPETRGLARRLVADTVENLWARRDLRGWRGRGVVLFPQDTSLAGGPDSAPVGEKVELSTQLQAWMALEADVSVSPPGE